jgi:hypothetical protein
MGNARGVPSGNVVMEARRKCVDEAGLFGEIVLEMDLRARFNFGFERALHKR